MQNHRALIQDVRGCMTQFLHLTPEIVEREATDGLTYDEMKRTLEECGMCIEKVLYDPSRRFYNAFYAEFVNGHYCMIPFQRASLSAVLCNTTGHIKQGVISQRLQERDWHGYYLMDVPLPMLIYDFERRYLNIDTEQVFKIWNEIYTRIDYSNGMWAPELLEYVFTYAPQTDLPETDADGYITIYRGMGEKSQPAETAISWTTDPICALWFANRSGRGTSLVTAQVKPEQILAYNPGYKGEHEVILKPGIKLEYTEVDMIPSTESSVPKLLIPITKEFFHYGSIATTLGYPIDRMFQVHGIKHILRVLVLTLIYSQHSGDDLTDREKQILIYFGLLHDIGRNSDCEDKSHGDRSVRTIQKRNIRIKGISLSKKEHQIANLLISNHCRDDETGLAAIQSVSYLTQKEKKRTSKLYAIAKDMDGLDRVRLNDLDFRYLRTPYARKLPLVAGGLLEEPLLECIQNYRAGNLILPDGI